MAEKIHVYSIEGKKVKDIARPSFFDAPVREDIVDRVLEAKKKAQPYAPNPMAGRQHAAKGKVVHRRHVWRSGYGRGGSRVPKKVFSQRGSQFNWEAAEVPHSRGGMRAHAPKVAHRLLSLSINKKELRMALLSALSASAQTEKIALKYASLDEVKLSLPVVISLEKDVKVGALKKGLSTILGKDLYAVASRKKSVRAGRGTMRGRKYKKTAGALIIVGKDEKLQTKSFDVRRADTLSVSDLAKGGVGRLAIYTEQALAELDKRLGGAQ